MTSRTFLVTGATRGIGLAVARHLHDRGHLVIGVARHAPDFAFPGRFFAGDLRKPDQAEQLFRQILDAGDVDGVVNNVGGALPQAIPDLTVRAFWDVMHMNVLPALLATKIFAPKMIERGFGRIVNISSTAALGAAGRSTYAAAKSALDSFTRSWALEVAASGITVNTVAPGNTTTEGFRRHCPPGSDLEARLTRRVPMGRLASPEDVATAVGFFLSTEAGYITGQTLFVDGGLGLRR